MLPRDLPGLGVSLILANTYHLHLRPGDDLIRDLGGLHQFMQWPGPILTDSGGFQVFSLAQINAIDDDGVTFRSHIDGSKHRLTPERSIEIQQNLGADIIMCFDECARPTDRDILTSRRQPHQLLGTSAAVKRIQTTASRRCSASCRGASSRTCVRNRPAFCSHLDFPGYAVGGLAVGESKAEMYATLDVTLPMLPDDKPRYLMGVGEPDDLIEAITRGIDIFDCVIPTRLARHGSALTPRGRLNMQEFGSRARRSRVGPWL